MGVNTAVVLRTRLEDPRRRASVRHLRLIGMSSVSDCDCFYSPSVPSERTTGCGAGVGAFVGCERASPACAVGHLPEINASLVASRRVCAIRFHALLACFDVSRAYPCAPYHMFSRSGISGLTLELRPISML